MMKFTQPEIKEVKSKRDLRAFIRFPETLYKGNPYWVPPLFIRELSNFQVRENPALERCEARLWLACRGKKIVGRIAGIINYPEIDKTGEKLMRFGWFDFYDDPLVSECLMNVVESWAKEKGMTALHGPLGFTDQDPVGVVVEGFDQMATFFEPQNYAYYQEHLEKLGFEKKTDWLEYEILVPPGTDLNISRLAGFAQQKFGLKWLDAKNRKDILKYAGEAFRLLNETHQHLYGVVPLSERQIENYIREFAPFMSPDYISAVLDQHDHLVAFGFTIPSLSKALQKAKGRLFPFGYFHLMKAFRKNERAELCLVAVKHSLQGRGVNAMLIHDMNCKYNKLGIKVVDSNPELESNHLVQGQWKYFERRLNKRRRCFIKHL